MFKDIELEMSTSTPNTSAFPMKLHLNHTNPGLPTYPRFPPYALLFLKISPIITIAVVPLTVLGLTTNIINMAVFSKLMKNDTVSISLLAMAVSDFMVCFTTFVATIGEFEEVQKLLLNRFSLNPREMIYLCVGYPGAHFGRITLTISTFITLERCLCVAMPLRVKLIFTSMRCKMIMVFCFLFCILQMVPNYNTYSLVWRYYPPLNKSILGYAVLPEDHGKSTFNGPFVLAYFYVNFSLIVICTIILVVVLKKKSNWRQSVTTATSSSKDSNQISSKELKVIKMMVMVSTLFIVCSIPTSVIYLAHEIDRDISMAGSKKFLYYTLGFFAIPIQTFNSSVNIFIYYIYSSNYKAVFDKMFNIRAREAADKSNVKGK